MRHAFMFAAVLALICLPAWANEGGSAAADPLDDTQMLLEGGGGPAVDAAVLMYFGTLEDQQEAISVLIGMVERLRETGREKPADSRQ